MKKVIIPIMLLFILFLFISCAVKKDIRLGFLGVISGRMGDLGRSGRDGSILAVDTLNETKGINGRRVEFLIEDSALDSDLCRATAQKLVNEGIEGLIGPLTSDMSLAVLDIFNDSQVAMISPTASTPKLSGIDDYFLRVNPSDESEGRELAKYAADILKSANVAVVYNIVNLSFSEGVYNSFNLALQSIKKTKVQAFTFNTDQEVDFFNLARPIADGGFDTLFIIASSIDTGTICQQIRKKNSDIRILATGWAMTDELIKQGGGTVEGTVFNHYHNNNSTQPAYLDFVKRFETRFNRTPDFIAVLGFNAVMVWAEAYRTKAKKQSVKERIIEIGTFGGLQGKITIDKYGDAALERHYIAIKNGEFIDL